MKIHEDIKFAEEKRFELICNFPNSLDRLESRIFTRISKSKLSNSRKLETLYEVMGKLSKYVYKFATCKKLCSKCCYIRVDISELEIEHIEKKYRIKRNKNIKPNTDKGGTACCFLKDGACSIYEGRPFVCRRHFFFTPDEQWCGHEVESDQEFPLVAFSEVDKSYNLIRKDSKSFQKYDIREVFGNE